MRSISFGQENEENALLMKNLHFILSTRNVPIFSRSRKVNYIRKRFEHHFECNEKLSRDQNFLHPFVS